MTTPIFASHDHPTPMFTAIEGTDMSRFALLLGAAWQGCLPCQERLTKEVVEGDAAVVAHAVAFAYMVSDDVLMRLVGVSAPVEELSEPVQSIVLAAKAMPSDRLDSSGWEAEARALNAAERRRAIDYALDTLVGLMSSGVLTAGRPEGG